MVMITQYIHSLPFAPLVCIGPLVPANKCPEVCGPEWGILAVKLG